MSSTSSGSLSGHKQPNHDSTLVMSLFELDRLPEDQWPVKQPKQVLPPPPITESMHKRRQVAEQQRAQGRGLSTDDAIDQLSSYMSPSCPFEFQLRRDAVVAATEHANNVVHTAARLHAMGYRVVVRNVSDTSVTWSTPAVNSFIVCTNREENTDVEYIIDVQFKEYFRTAYMSATYKSLWHTLPAIFAGISYRLAGAVQLLSEEVELSFLEEGRPIPPWRSSSVAIRRWLSTNHTDHPPPSSSPTPPGAPPAATSWEPPSGSRGPAFPLPGAAAAAPAAPPLRRRSPLSSLTTSLLGNLSSSGPSQPAPQNSPPKPPTRTPSTSSSAASSPTPIRTFPLAPRLPTPTGTLPSSSSAAAAAAATTATLPRPYAPRPTSNRPPPAPSSSSSAASSPSSSAIQHPSPRPTALRPDPPTRPSSPRPTPSPRRSHPPPPAAHSPRARGRESPTPSSPYAGRQPCRSPSSSSTSCSPLRSPPASTLEPTSMSTPTPAPPLPTAPAPRIPQPAPINCRHLTNPSPHADTPLHDVPTSKSIQDFISFLAHINNQPTPPPPHPHAPSSSATASASRQPPPSRDPPPPVAPPLPVLALPPSSAPPASSDHLKPIPLSPRRHCKSHPTATYLTACSTTSALAAPTLTHPPDTIPSHHAAPYPYPTPTGYPPADPTASAASTQAAAGALGSSNTTTSAAIPIPSTRKPHKMRSLLADALGRWR